MANHISSAEPDQLIRYSDHAVRLDQDIIEHSASLDRRLSWFEATCREPGFSISSDSLASAVRSYGHKCLPVDAWVKSVGQDFERADSLHSVPSRLTLPEIRAMVSTAVDGIAEWIFTTADEIDKYDKYKVAKVPDSVLAAGMILKAHDLLVNPGKTLERSRAWRKAIDDHGINSDEAKEARFEYSKTNPIGLLKIFGDEGVRRWEKLKYDGPFDNAWEIFISPFKPPQVYGAETLDPAAQEIEISPSSSALSPFPALLSIPDWLRDRILGQNLTWLIRQLEVIVRALRWFILPFPPYLPFVPPPLLGIVPPIFRYLPPIKILPWTPSWLENIQIPTQPPASAPPIEATKSPVRMQVLHLSQINPEDDEIMSFERYAKRVDGKPDRDDEGNIKTVKQHIARYGCLITSYAMILRSRGYHDVTVADIYQTKITAAGGEIHPNKKPPQVILWDLNVGEGVINNHLEKMEVDHRFTTKTLEGADPASRLDDLKKQIAKYGPLIVHVKSSDSTFGHWVVATGVGENGSIQIEDPQDKHSTLDGYGLNADPKYRYLVEAQDSSL